MSWTGSSNSTQLLAITDDSSVPWLQKPIAYQDGQGLLSGISGFEATLAGVTLAAGPVDFGTVLYGISGDRIVAISGDVNGDISFAPWYQCAPSDIDSVGVSPGGGSVSYLHTWNYLWASVTGATLTSDSTDYKCWVALIMPDLRVANPTPPYPATDTTFGGIRIIIRNGMAVVFYALIQPCDFKKGAVIHNQLVVGDLSTLLEGKYADYLSGVSDKQVIIGYGGTLTLGDQICYNPLDPPSTSTADCGELFVTGPVDHPPIVDPPAVVLVPPTFPLYVRYTPCPGLVGDDRWDSLEEKPESGVILDNVQGICMTATSDVRFVPGGTLIADKTAMTGCSDARCTGWILAKPCGNDAVAQSIGIGAALVTSFPFFFQDLTNGGCYKIEEGATVTMTRPDVVPDDIAVLDGCDDGQCICGDCELVCPETLTVTFGGFTSSGSIDWTVLNGLAPTIGRAEGPPGLGAYCDPALGGLNINPPALSGGQIDGNFAMHQICDIDDPFYGREALYYDGTESFRLVAPAPGLCPVKAKWVYDPLYGTLGVTPVGNYAGVANGYVNVS